MRMYKVVAKCGHVGRNHFVLKTFPVKAQNGKEAAKIVRNLPRVKHHHKDAIRSVEEITVSEYVALERLNREDPYFSCNNVQDQRAYEEIIYNEDDFMFERESEKSNRLVYYGKELLRNPKRFMRNIYMTERYAV